LEVLEFTVEGVPVPKGRPRFFRGHAVTPKRTRDYEKKVREVAMAAAAECGWVADDRDCWLNVIVCRAAKRGDLDNYVKAITDAINGVAYDDDRRIAYINAVRREDKNYPKVTVRLSKS
jgi:crossover junction endodeoxyribonuclease RusA